MSGSVVGDIRCNGCGYTKYGHHMAIERMVATAHDWRPALGSQAAGNGVLTASGVENDSESVEGADRALDRIEGDRA